jgi:hypothetical protein
MGEVRCERTGSGARTAADIKEGVELAAGGSMVVYDGFIQVRVVASAILGVIRALVLGVGAERLFGRDGDKSGRRIRHGDGSFITRNCGLLCDVVWTLTLRKEG